MLSATPRIVVLPVLFLLSCFAPDPSKAVFRCDDSNACPEGLVCTAGICTAVMTSDLATVDQSMMMMMTGCADNKGSLVGSAWACPGAFGIGQAAARCASGYHVCTDATKVNLAQCNALTGFFAADVKAKWSPPWGLSINCGAAGGPLDNKVFFGCGAVANSDYQPDSTGTTCSGFARAVNCPTPTKTWDCTAGHALSTTANNLAQDGLLCCN